MTGGAGYIGSVVVRHLLGAGHHVTVVDNLVTGHKSNLPSEVDFVQVDISDRSVMCDCLTGQDAVLHFAASISVGDSMASPTTYFRNNAVHTIDLLDAMLATGVKKFLFSSTAALYGQPQFIPVTETHPLQPLNPYGESKLMVERVLAWLHRCQGLSYASLRYFNAAGGKSPQRDSVNLIPVVLEVARGQRSHLEIFGTDFPTPDGTAIRDYIHVEDLATAHLLALEALETRGQLIYNLGSEKGTSVREVVTSAQTITGRRISVVCSPRRQGDPAEMLASSDLIRKELGWMPTHSNLETIIQSAWEQSDDASEKNTVLTLE